MCEIKIRRSVQASNVINSSQLQTSHCFGRKETLLDISGTDWKHYQQ